MKKGDKKVEFYDSVCQVMDNKIRERKTARKKEKLSLLELRDRTLSTLTVVVIATIFNLLAITGSQWISSNSSVAKSYSEGLWRSCTGNICTSIGVKQNWRLYCQFFALVSCGLSFISILVLAITLLIEKSRWRIVIFILMQSLALSIAEMIMYTYMMRKKFDVTFGYSYAFAWINILFLCIGSVTLNLDWSRKRRTMFGRKRHHRVYFNYMHPKDPLTLSSQRIK